MSSTPSLATYFVLVLAVLVLQTDSITSPTLSPTQIYVDGSRKYQNLVVSINMRLESNEEEGFLHMVKERLKYLSEDIHHILGLQFGNITLLVPAHWKGPSYQTVYNLGPETSDILILSQTEEVYTQHIQGCGREALHLRISSDYLYSDSSDGRRRLKHEWLHTRYGVFDEHPLTPEEAALLYTKIDTQIDTQKFYHSSKSTIEAVRCDNQLTTETNCAVTKTESYADLDQYTSLPKSKCNFTICTPGQETASLMSHYQIDNVVLLCNDSTHNAEAPNRHNRLCQRRSAYSIFSEHPDFNASNVKTNYVEPIFTVRKLPRSRTVVFVLDTSNSMNGTRLAITTQAISSMIETIIEDFAQILIVKFDLNPAQLHPSQYGTLAELDSTRARQEAVQSLKTITTGQHTCIGCGLQLAYNITKMNGGASRTSFILLTDGRDTKKKTLKNDLYETSKAESFLIDTILLSDEADDDLKSIAEKAGSSTFSANEDPAALIDAYTEMITSRQNLTTQVIQIYSDTFSTAPGQTKTAEFEIEGHLTTMAQLLFYMSSDQTSTPTFKLVRKNDEQVLHEGSPQNSEFGYIKIPLDIDGIYKDEQCVRFTFMPASSYVADFSQANVVKQTIFVDNRIANVGKNNTYSNVVTVNTRNQKALQDDDREKRSTTAISEQPYAMKAYVSGETKFTITQDSATPMVTIHAYLPPGSVSTPPTSVIATITVAEIGDTSADEFQVRLRDGGVVADVIPNDSVYSAYFTNFVSYNATYTVRIRATGDGYTRYASTGYFSAYVAPNMDMSALLPPATILDLMVMRTSADKITLSFTDTGAALDSGTAYGYKVLYSFDFASLTEDTPSSLVKEAVTSEKPGAAYTHRMIDLDLPRLKLDTNDTLWIALKTVDTKNGKVSNLSNVVSARYITEIDRTTPSPIIKGLPNEFFWLILAIVLTLILLIFLILCIFCFYRRQRKERQENRNSSADVRKFFSPDNNTIGRASEIMISDLAEQDFVEIDAAQRYHTYKADSKVVSTKRPRIKSFKFSAASLKRKSKKDTEAPAPQPPQRNTVSFVGDHNSNNLMTNGGNTVNQNGTDKSSVQQSNFARVVTEKRDARTTDEASFPGDLEEGERIAQNGLSGHQDPEAGAGDVHL